MDKNCDQKISISFGGCITRVESTHSPTTFWFSFSFISLHLDSTTSRNALNYITSNHCWNFFCSFVGHIARGNPMPSIGFPYNPLNSKIIHPIFENIHPFFQQWRIWVAYDGQKITTRKSPIHLEVTLQEQNQHIPWISLVIGILR